MVDKLRYVAMRILRDFAKYSGKKLKNLLPKGGNVN
jgi:hypothetical protein